MGFVLTTVTIIINQKQKSEVKIFEYQGFADYSEDVVDPKDLKEIILGEYERKPHYAKIKQGVVQTPESAANIGMAVLSSKYGEERVNSYKPFHVSLVNNRIWLVKGYNRIFPKQELMIWILKDDASILSIREYGNEKCNFNKYSFCNGLWN